MFWKHLHGVVWVVSRLIRYKWPGPFGVGFGALRPGLRGGSVGLWERTVGLLQSEWKRKSFSLLSDVVHILLFTAVEHLLNLQRDDSFFRPLQEEKSPLFWGKVSFFHRWQKKMTNSWGSFRFVFWWFSILSWNDIICAYTLIWKASLSLWHRIQQEFFRIFKSVRQ